MKLLWLLLAWLAFGEVSARSKCGPHVFKGSSNNKRSVGFLRIERNITRTPTQTALAKRMRTPEDLTPPSMHQFYKYEFPRLSRKFAPPDDSYDDPTWYSAAMMLEYYSRARRREFSTGVGGLKGCTALYIISRKAVYVTHWWEDVSFHPADFWEVYSNDELFEYTVTDMLREGGRFHAPLDAEQIEDDHIKAYLVRPKPVYRQIMHPDQNLPDYSEQWNQIKTTVGELVPKLTDPARWGDVTYYPAGTDAQLFAEGSIRGMSLFKYEKAPDTSTGQTRERSKLWFEGRLVHEDEW